jgi:hypothetical protein
VRSRVVTVLVALGVLVGVVVWSQFSSHPSAPEASGPAPASTPATAHTSTPHASGKIPQVRPHPVAAAPLPPLPGGASAPVPQAAYKAPGVPSPGNIGPGTAPLRLNFVSGAPELEAPGLAVNRGSLQVDPGSPAAFDTETLQRPVTITGASWLRLHLTHQAPGDLALQVTVSDVRPDGSTVVLAEQQVTVPAAVAAAGPKSNADLTVGTHRVTIPAGDVLRLSVGFAALTADQLTLYYGALPGEDESNSTHDQLEAADGGPNPARLMVPVSELSGAFRPY